MLEGSLSPCWDKQLSLYNEAGNRQRENQVAFQSTVHHFSLWSKCGSDVEGLQCRRLMQGSAPAPGSFWACSTKPQRQRGKRTQKGSFCLSWAPLPRSLAVVQHHCSEILTEMSKRVLLRLFNPGWHKETSPQTQLNNTCGKTMKYSHILRTRRSHTSKTTHFHNRQDKQVLKGEWKRFLKGGTNSTQVEDIEGHYAGEGSPEKQTEQLHQLKQQNKRNLQSNLFRLKHYCTCLFKGNWGWKLDFFYFTTYTQQLPVFEWPTWILTHPWTSLYFLKQMADIFYSQFLFKNEVAKPLAPDLNLVHTSGVMKNSFLPPVQ